MRQGWKTLPIGAALALIMTIGAPPTHSAPAKSATAAAPSAPGAKSKSKNSLRQFSGVVTAFDKSTITVEKSGKKPKTMVFVKHAEMRTQGELEKAARVTVYYREEGGQVVAHRIVVKSEAAAGNRG